MKFKIFLVFTILYNSAIQHYNKQANDNLIPMRKLPK